MKYSDKRKKLRDELFIGEKVFVLTKELKRRLRQASSISNLCKTYFISIKTGHLS